MAGRRSPQAAYAIGVDALANRAQPFDALAQIGYPLPGDAPVIIPVAAPFSFSAPWRDAASHRSRRSALALRENPAGGLSCRCRP